MKAKGKRYGNEIFLDINHWRGGIGGAWLDRLRDMGVAFEENGKRAANGDEEREISADAKPDVGICQEAGGIQKAHI